MLVLVVDDQEPFRRALSAVVEGTAGFQVAGSATSGEESLAACAALRPQLVLMDVHLPGIDGVEASRRIREQPQAPIVVLLSTYDEHEFDHTGSGAAGYISKRSLSPDRLSAVWEQATRSGAAG